MKLNDANKLVACVAGAICLFAACHSGDPVPTPIVENDQSNVVTDRQKLVEGFQSAEVISVPYSSTEFIARDTNGSVWYVNTAQTTNKGMTRLLDPFVPPSTNRPANLNFIGIADTIAARDRAVLAMIAAVVAASLQTNNVHNVTNVWTWDPPDHVPPKVAGAMRGMIYKAVKEYLATNRIIMAEDPK